MLILASHYLILKCLLWVIFLNIIVARIDLADYLAKPQITSRSKNNAINGEPLRLDCHLYTTLSQIFSLKFILPNGKQAVSNENVILTSSYINDSVSTFHTSLTIHNPYHKNDEGNYTCYVEDRFNSRNFAVKSIKFIKEPFIRFESYYSKLTIKWHEIYPTEIIFNYSGCPDVNLEYYKENGFGNVSKEYIDHKNDIIIYEDQITFNIAKLKIEDQGNYTFVLSNKAGIIKERIELVIEGLPVCELESVYALQGEEITFKCNCKAFPEADIFWYFKFCFHPCNNYTIIKNKTMETKVNGYTKLSEIKIIAEYHGEMKCFAQNNQGNSFSSGTLHVSDISEPFQIVGLDKQNKIAIGDELKLECRAFQLSYSDNIRWLKNGNDIFNRYDLSVTTQNTKFSYGISLHFRTIKKEDEGEYTCEVYDLNRIKHSISIILKIFDAQFPTIKTSFSQNQISKLDNEDLILDCFANGLPTPVVTWTKNGRSIMLKEHFERLTFRNNNMTLEFIALKQEHSGHYACIAENRLGKVEKSIDIHVEHDHIYKNILISLSVVLILLILLLLFTWINTYRNKKLIAELKAAGLDNFEEGNFDCINFDINLDEQADLLPYDKSFEFPRDKLRLQKQLGAGAFGVVYEGIANGIVENESETVVAVKMVKKQASNEVIKALVSELKILVYLGQHRNIVNLLGAVTKNIAKKELMVIFEYCRFGNLQTYLVNNRSNFIDQVRNGKIAPVLKENAIIESNSGVDSESQGIKYLSVVIVNDKTTADSNEENSNQSIEKKTLDSKLRTSLSTSDLVGWAFQIARGMEYISKNKIIHGDLAARNILLCDNNIVKICDFGLSKSIYKNDVYKRKGENLLPFKWLSLEAISDSVFSVYSDVWSYGIMLWEFFSLGTVPYPGMDASENLFYKIREGYRMEKPDFATEDIYDIMLSCWNVVPESRPLFSELERAFSSLMVDSVKNHYIVLNERYVRANARNNKGDARNYLPPITVPLSNAPKPSSSKQTNLYIKSKATTFSESSIENSQPMSDDRIDDSQPSSSLANLSPKFDESTNVSGDKNNSKLQFQEELRLKLLKCNLPKTDD